MLAAMAGAGILCVPLVRMLKIASLVRASGAQRRGDINRTVHDLVGLAEIREREDLVTMAESAARMKDSLLIRGVTLALEGENSQAIRSKLESSYLGAALVSKTETADVVRSILTVLCLLFAFGGAVGIVASSIEGITISPLAGGLAAGAVFTGLLSSVMSRADWTVASSTRQSELLRRLIVVEGVIALAEGLDSAAMKRRLMHLLPGQNAIPGAVKRAA